MPVNNAYKTTAQVSSGGIIYRIVEGRPEVALICVGRGRKVWALPKGGAEDSETPEETAVREVREETGLNGEMVAKIDDIKYWYMARDAKMRFAKTVHFFLVRYISGSTDDHDREVLEAKWFPIDEAETIIAYENERRIMKRAREMIEARPLIH